MVKGAAACNEPQGRECGRVILSVRGLMLPSGLADTITYIPPGRPCTKFWVAVRSENEVHIERAINNDRESYYRQRPDIFFM